MKKLISILIVLFFALNLGAQSKSDFLNYLRDSLSKVSCDSIIKRTDFTNFEKKCNQKFSDYKTIKKLIGSNDTRVVDSVSKLLNRCDTLNYCAAQERFKALSDSILESMEISEQIKFLNEVSKLELGLKDGLMTKEELIVYQYFLTKNGLSTSEISRRCGISESDLYNFFARANRCLRQLRFYSPVLLNTNLGNINLMCEFEQSQHGSSSFSMGFRLQTDNLFPNLSMGVSRLLNLERNSPHLVNANEIGESGILTSMPLGPKSQKTGFMVMVDKSFKVTKYANLGYEGRINYFKKNSEVASNGNFMLTGGVKIDQVARDLFKINLCGINLSIGGFWQALDVDQHGQFRISKLVPKSIVPKNAWTFNNFGSQINLGIKF